MHDVPKELMDTIHELEKLFTVDTHKMHQIVDRFVSELEKGKLYISFQFNRKALTAPPAGLTKEGGSIVSPFSRPVGTCI